MARLIEHALPAPELRQLDRGTTYFAPRTPIEELLAEMWAGLLSVEPVGIYDNFFDQGGHSLIGDAGHVED